MSSFSDAAFLLALPTELRLQVYDYCLADANTVTVTAAHVTVFGNKIRDLARRDIAGLPREYSPLVRYGYDASLLSLSEPPTIALDGAAAHLPPQCDRLARPAPLALLQSCRAIHQELSDYMARRRPQKAADGLALYVTYPYGVVVLKELYPHLVRQARDIYISGYYSPPASPSPSPSPSPAKRPRPPSPPRTLPPFPACTAAHAPTALAHLMRAVLSPDPGPLRTLEARIVAPGELGALLACDDAPIRQMLTNICGGDVQCRMARGRDGSAACLTVRPDPGKRLVSSTYVHMGHGPGEMEAMVVGEHWGMGG